MTARNENFAERTVHSVVATFAFRLMTGVVGVLITILLSMTVWIFMDFRTAIFDRTKWIADQVWNIQTSVSKLETQQKNNTDAIKVLNENTIRLNRSFGVPVTTPKESK